MRLLRNPKADAFSRRRAQRAFTLPETMVTATVSMIVLAGLITTYVFGLRLFEFTKPKLGASDNARDALGKVIIELRSANSILVGTGTGSGFTRAASGSPLQGNAVKVYATTNTNSYAVYYLDTDQKLKRRSTSSGTIDVIANCLSNQNSLVFTTENFAGNVLTNDTLNSVIGMSLQFYQIEYPIIRIGTNQFYDSYTLRTKITQRVWDIPTS